MEAIPLVDSCILYSIQIHSINFHTLSAIPANRQYGLMSLLSGSEDCSAQMGLKLYQNVPQWVWFC